MNEKMKQNMTEMQKELLCAIIQQIQTYPVYTNGMKFKRIVKKIMGKKVAPIDRFFWPHAMLAYALMEVHRSTNSEDALRTLTDYAESYIQKGVPIHYVDNVMNGEVLLYLFQLNGSQRYMNAAEKLADYAMDNKSLIYRKSNPTHVYVDALGMVCPMLTHIGSQQYLQKSITYLLDFFEKGMDAISGLPYHGYDIVSGEKMGIIGWGRAVGWLLMALTGSLQYIGDETVKFNKRVEVEFEELKHSFEKLVKTTFAYQKEDGLFSWQLQAIQGPSDTSATAMILYATKQGMKSGILSDTYSIFVEKGERGLCSHVKNGKVDQCLAECMGYSQYPQVYGSYPWGLAMTGALLFME